MKELENDNVINVSSSKIDGNYFSNGELYSDNSDDLCPYVSLWRAVILQALQDAGSNSKKPEFKKNKARAISWLTIESDDLKEVCEMAELPVKYVMKSSAKAIKNNCKWRRDAGFGSNYGMPRDRYGRKIKSTNSKKKTMNKLKLAAN